MSQTNFTYAQNFSTIHVEGALSLPWSRCENISDASEPLGDSVLWSIRCTLKVI
uniref:Uncharacterized protein n=1 Tax=Arundo donax TaxID=35708 RepID=A0A0A8YF28_ARUDO